MQPITVHLPDLNSFGPLWYLFAHFAVVMCLMVMTFRYIAAAGKYGSSRNQHQMNSCIARAVVSGVLGVINLIVVFCMSNQLFEKSLAQTSRITTSLTSPSLDHIEADPVSLLFNQIMKAKEEKEKPIT